MKKQKKRSSWILMDMSALFVIALLLLMVAVCFDAPEKQFSESAINMMTQWEAADGENYSLEALPKGNIVMTHSLEGMEIADKQFCLKSIDTFIEVAADGKTVYTYAPEQPKFLGKSYGRYLHTIPVPPETKKLTLSVHPIFKEAPADLEDAVMEDAGMYMGNLYRKALPDYSVCLLMVTFGIVMLFMGVTNKNLKQENDMNFYSLGTFAVLNGLWAVNDTYILQALTQFPAMIKLLNYLCLIFNAYPSISFIASATNHKNTVLLKILRVLVVVNFTLTLLLNAWGICDMHYMLNVSLAIIALSICMAIYLLIRAVRHKSIDKHFAQTLGTGIGPAVIGISADLIRYKIGENHILGTSAFTRIGVLIFLLVLGIHLIHERHRLTIERNRAEIMAKMAYTDGLTELHNRIAFSEKEKEICSNEKSCVVVQLDVNFLKKVNDVYGHAEGDRHIIAAAHIIRDSFEKIGICYRTGGDEFIVVAEYGGKTETENALEEMQRKIHAYNNREKPPVPLEIAYGYAEYTPSEELTEVERLADQRMYTCKKKMKAAALY